jgi:glycosyltransferase involved in cell wall biosynthesis
MMTQMHICLISSVHLWVNPRLVKEADSLVEKGFKVTVITVSKNRWASKLDERLLKTKTWRAVRINIARDDPSGRLNWFVTAVRSKLALRAARFVPALDRLHEEGYYRAYAHVLREAIKCKADLYIAHTQGALPIAARCAEYHGVPFGFDCEDLLAEEIADGLQSGVVQEAIYKIEERYLPLAAYVTATSEAMADYLVGRYGIRRPLVVHNVFPRKELAGEVPPSERPQPKGLRLVWMSASIGGGRGIEDAIRSMALLPSSFELHLFGRMLPEYKDEFWGLVNRMGVRERVFLKGLVDHQQLMRIIASFDVGLATDLNSCANRSLTITNKLFVYLQCGLVVCAANTPGQRELMGAVPGAGFIYEPGDHETLARLLARYHEDRELLTSAKQAAWIAARQIYCWDAEQTVFLKAVDAALSLPKFKNGRMKNDLLQRTGVV